MRALNWMPMSTSTSFNTLFLHEAVAPWLVFLYWKTRTFRAGFTQDVPSWRAETRTLFLHPFEPYHECTATGMASVVRIVEADDRTNFPKLRRPAASLLHRDDGFVPSHVERLQVVVLQLDFKFLIEVSISLIQSLLLSDFLAHEDTSLLKFSRRNQKFLKPSQTSNSNFSVPFFLEAQSFTNRSSSSKGSLKTFKWRMHLRTWSTEGTAEMDKQAVTSCSKRTSVHTFQQGGIIGTQSSTSNSCRFRLVFSSTCTHSRSDKWYTPHLA